MKNMRIGAKLTTSFGAVGLMLAGLSFFSVVELGAVHQLTLAAVDNRMPKMMMADELNAATSDFRIAEAQHILAVEPADIMATERVLDARRDVIERDYGLLDKGLANATAREALEQFRTGWDSYLADDRALLGFSRQNKNAEASALMRGKSQHDYDVLRNATGRLVRIEAGLAKASAEEAGAVYGRARLLTFVALGLALLGMAAILAALIRGLAHPLVGMTKAMGELAAGNMAAQVPVDPRADEIGDLATAMGRFRDQLAAAERAKAEQTEMLVSSIGEGLTRLAAGDLVSRVEADLTGPFARLKEDFNRALAALQTAMGQVAQATSGIHTGAAEIRQASDDLSQRTEQQAASLEETAAAMDEITTTVRKTAEDAGRANDAVDAARGEAEQSGAVVRRAVTAMGGIERSSAEISEIISVIDGIAFQTNLLALNAGVEAARAGDAGKGFAVVASEVRALAQRSAEAAKDVKTRILASSEQVEAGVALVSETGQALERIIARIGDISGLVAAIAGSAERQASGLAQVNTAVGEMDNVTQQNAAMVEEATAAARSLSGEADELARHIARFETGESIERTPAPAAAPATVHQLQDRAAAAGRRIARTAPRRGTAAVAVAAAEDDWSSF